MCKEMTPGGAKTCQPETTCSKECLPGDYCAANNQYKEGEPEDGIASDIITPGIVIQYYSALHNIF